jgi:hypothetical protein
MMRVYSYVESPTYLQGNTYCNTATDRKNGRILFDKPKPTAGCNANGRSIVTQNCKKKIICPFKHVQVMPNFGRSGRDLFEGWLALLESTWRD